MVQQEAPTVPGLDSEVAFWHEYDSGCAAVSVTEQELDGTFFAGTTVAINLANRGTHREAAQVLLCREEDAPSATFNSGPVFIEPGFVGDVFFSPAPNDSIQLGVYWARVFTTSENVVPSMTVINPAIGSPPNATPEHRVSFGPGDFAHFTLTHDRPPIGPAEP